MLRTTSIKYLTSRVSIATVVCKNKRLKYVMLTNCHVLAWVKLVNRIPTLPLLLIMESLTGI
jgi:hypothetical protein